jgi:hypothetical protein
MRYTDLPLPGWRCVPVHVALPDRARLDPVVASVPARLATDEVADLEAFRYGIDLYNSGFCWEAHEVWEPVWAALPPNARERHACQSLIQGANAFFKLDVGRPKAFHRLVGEARRHAAEATVLERNVCGVELAAWCERLREFASKLPRDGVPQYRITAQEADAFPALVMCEGT